MNAVYFSGQQLPNVLISKDKLSFLGSMDSVITCPSKNHQLRKQRNCDMIHIRRERRCFFPCFTGTVVYYLLQMPFSQCFPQTVVRYILPIAHAIYR